MNLRLYQLDAMTTVEEVIPAYTRRYGGLANAQKRAAHEVVIGARKRKDNER